MTANLPLYHRHRFPAEIISYCVGIVKLNGGINPILPKDHQKLGRTQLICYSTSAHISRTDKYWFLRSFGNLEFRSPPDRLIHVVYFNAHQTSPKERKTPNTLERNTISRIGIDRWVKV